MHMSHEKQTRDGVFDSRIALRAKRLTANKLTRVFAVAHSWITA
jgi:hypothetical protein